MRPYDRSPSRTYGCPSMTTTHNFDQCSPTSGSVVIIWMVLASRNTAGSHPGTALSSAHAAVAIATDKTNESSARLAIRQIFILVGIISTRVHSRVYNGSFIARDVDYPGERWQRATRTAFRQTSTAERTTNGQVFHRERSRSRGPQRQDHRDNRLRQSGTISGHQSAPSRSPGNRRQPGGRQLASSEGRRFRDSRDGRGRRSRERHPAAIARRDRTRHLPAHDRTAAE